MWVPGTVGISSGELRAPPFRHVVTESQAGPPQGTALTPGSAYSRATLALRPTPASFIQIVARNHPDCRRADPADERWRPTLPPKGHSPQRVISPRRT